jgi:hypothetical protein
VPSFYTVGVVAHIPEGTDKDYVVLSPSGYSASVSMVTIMGLSGNTGPQGASGSTVTGPQGIQGIPGDLGLPGTTDWNLLTNKPSTFAPIIGGGAGDAVAGNDARLTDARAPTAHNHSWSNITNPPATFPPEPHTHTWANISDPPPTYTPSAHNHSWSNITNPPATYAPSTHNHNASDINAGTLATARLGSGTADATTFLRGDQTYASPGAASTNIKETEVDFGMALNQRAKSFTVTDADVGATNQLLVFQSLAAATAKSQDENEMDALMCRAVAGSGQFTVYAESLFGSVTSTFKLNYLIG